ADNRGYKFDRNKIINKRLQSKINVTTGQVTYEYSHLLNKLKNRDPALHKQLKDIKIIKVHPMFHKIPGKVEHWEIVS
ncbi:MAG: pyrimidine dimer DNA glycosylase/endonuclease V, partial [Gammaproteobacteria bacterium]